MLIGCSTSGYLRKLVNIHSHTMACIPPVYTKHSTLGATRHDTQLPYRLYLAANTMVPSHCKCVQQVKGLWKIYPATIEARNKLLESGIMFKKHKISLLDRDPFLTDKIPSEKIIFRDVPLDVPDDEVIQFLREHSNVTLRSSIVCDRIRDNNNHLTDCFNGNRHVYVQSGFTPVLPEIATIGNHKCRIYHESQALSCKRCHEDGHRAIDINVCPAYIPEDNTIQIFWRSWDPLSNFYECKLEIYDHVFYSSEHAYQYQKMAHIGNEKLANEVLQAQTPKDAKNIANCVPSDKLQDWHNIKLDVMKEILVAKVKSCDKYRNALLGSGSNCLIEGTMDLYWGCGQTAYLASTTHPYYLPGQNWLGSIHSDIRHQVVHGQLPRNGPSRQPIRSTTPLCKPTDNPPRDVTSNIATTATVGTSDAAPAVGISADAPTVGASADALTVGVSAAASTIPTTNTAPITTVDASSSSTPTVTDVTSNPVPVITDVSVDLHEVSMQSQDSDSVQGPNCANSSTMTPTTITSVVTPTPEASTSTTDINSAIITTAEIHHQKEVCEDYTVSNISRIMQPLDQSSDTPSIAEEIQEAEIPKRRIVKPNKPKNKPPLTPLQKGPLDNFISRVKRKLTPEKELDASVNNQKQICSETSKI